MHVIAPLYHKDFEAELEIKEYSYYNDTGSLLVISSSKTMPRLVIEITDEGDLVARLSGADGPDLLLNQCA